MKTLSTYIKNQEINIIAVGDILLHKKSCDFYKQHSINNIFSKISPIIKNYDLAYYNQEGVLGGDEVGWYGGKPEKLPNGHEKNRFNNPSWILDKTVECGFNMVSLANNHILDLDEKYRIKHIKSIKNKNIYYTGSWISQDEMKPCLININGWKIGFISYTDKINTTYAEKEYMRNDYNEVKVKNDVDYLRKHNVDLIICAMHWGNENTHYSLSADKEIPTKTQKDIAEFLASLNIDVVIGTHSHFIEPIDKINNTIVAYSLGNFLEDQSGNEMRHKVGAMLKLNIVRSNKKNKITPSVELSYLKKENSGEIVVYPFSKLNENILGGYRSIEQYYMNIINSKKILK
jgi:poly-gamma-glutamate synthesis protein (capsule biosynthesis protein)